MYGKKVSTAKVVPIGPHSLYGKIAISRGIKAIPIIVRKLNVKD